jgi:hypothetical protein
MEPGNGEMEPVEIGDVFAMYGTAMFVVQTFEYALKQPTGLLEPELPKDVSFEKAWRETEKLLRKAIGPLKDQLDRQGQAPEELREKVDRLIKPRNFLAHEYLLNFTLETNAGLTSPEEAVEELQPFIEVFQAARDELDELSNELLRELGVDPFEPALLDEEARRILAEVKADRDE